jgi:hypothetical protein
MSRRFLATSAIALAFSVSACGGDGNRPTPLPFTPTPTPTPTPSPTPTPTPTPPPNYDTAEYRASNYAVAAKAITAYQHGATGKGVKIAVIDTGINPELKEFAGRIDPASRDVAGQRGVSDEDGHGTAVTAVAAAARDGVGTMGVAFDATIISLRADRVGSCAEDDGCRFNDSAIASGVDTARLAGARVINLSLGGGGIGSTLLSAMQRAVSAGIVLVISAGNDGEANPDAFSLTPAQHFPGMVIIAGSIGAPDGSGGTDLNQISTFSNRAGTGAVHYLTALGYRNRAPDHTGTNYLWSGTSFSAPVISGAVALLAHAFPNLTGRQIVDILFKSADDLGAAGVDDIFGRGRLNLDRAFQPIGTTSLADSKAEVDTIDNGDLPSAAGDANSGASFGAIILDGYDRAFVLDLARTFRQAPQSQPLTQALQPGARINSVSMGPLTVAMTVAERRDLPQGFGVESMGIGPEDERKARLVAGSAIARIDNKTAIAFGFSEGAKAMERRLASVESGSFLIAKNVAAEPGFAAIREGSMAMRRDVGPVSVTVSTESGTVWSQDRSSAAHSPYRLSSVSVDRQLGGTWLSAGVSRLDERQTFLGGRLDKALGGGGASTVFLDLEARHNFGSGISAGASARRGWTDFAGGRMQTDSYGFDLAKKGVLGANDRLGFRVSQPLRVASGGFAMLLPTAYDYSTQSATSSWTTYSLAPSGREIDAELSYGASLLDGSGWLGGNLFMRRQPGHVASADNDYGAAIRFTLGF